MAGPKVSSGDATAEVCVNCGMPPCKVDPTLSITLLFSKATRQVLCLEAGKDFVDTLMGFLTLPVGCIVKLLEQASLIHRPECKLAPRPSTPLVFPPDCPYTPAPKKGKNDSGEHFALSSISNVFESVVRLDSKEMSTEKKCLLDPKPTVPFGAGQLLDLQNKEPVATTENSAEIVDVANYYSCGNACSLYSTSPATKCPKHKKKMSVPMKFVAGNLASGSDGTDRGEEDSQERPDSIKSVRSSRGQRGRQCASDSCAPEVPSRRSLRVRSVVPASDSEFVRRVTRGLDMQLALPTSPGPSIEPKGGGGYVKKGTKYMVTNTLEIYASAEAIKALIALNIIRCERVGDLDTMPISVVTAEVQYSFSREVPAFFSSVCGKPLLPMFSYGDSYGIFGCILVRIRNFKPAHDQFKAPSLDFSLCYVRESQQQFKTKLYMVIIVEDDPGPEKLESHVKV